MQFVALRLVVAPALAGMLSACFVGGDDFEDALAVRLDGSYLVVQVKYPGGFKPLLRGFQLGLLVT